MKRLLLLSMFILPAFVTKAQTKDTLANKSDTTVYAAVEHLPEFPGGIAKFYQYLGQNIRYPRTAFNNDIGGRVFVQMIVEKDGSISHVTALRKVSRELDNEAIRVVSQSPKWNPGKQGGLPVRVRFSIPITFTTALNMNDFKQKRQ